MIHTDAQSVLRCARCNKPFDKQASLKRHGYYCQSKSQASATRLRACASCAAGKARCDNRQPSCSKCLAKGIDCQYPPVRAKETGRQTHHSRETTSNRVGTVSTSSTPSPDTDYRPATGGGEAASNDTYDLTYARDPLDLDAVDLGFGDEGFDFTDLLGPSVDDEGALFPSTPSSAAARQSAPLAHQMTTRLQQFGSFAGLSMPLEPSQAVPSLLKRPKFKTASQRTANLVLCTMKSYPLMISRHHSLPPFIHPHVTSAGVGTDDMEPLDNCISLLHMASAGVRGSRKLFWRNVRMECERICAEHQHYSKWELLASMQALALYTIVRLDEGEREYNNVDHLLIATVAILSKALTNGTGACMPDPMRSWSDWIFEESVRRLCVVYQVLDMVVFFQPAALCHLHQTDLVLAPLPSSKRLWEAKDEAAWKAESAGHRDARIRYALARDGDLVKFDLGRLSCGDGAIGPRRLTDEITQAPPLRMTADWDEWCSGMDELGGLVMLAAALTSCAQ